MFRLHQLKDLSKTDNYYGDWHIFKNYDVYTHMSTATGLQITQLLNGLISILNSYRRLPAAIVLIMSEKLMLDKVLKPEHLQDVLRCLCRKSLRAIECYMEKVPAKALPLQKTKLYITKPLPQPASFFVGNNEKLKHFASMRRAYNTMLVSVVKEFGIGFINVGINQEDGTLFKSTSEKHRFALNETGLNSYWLGVSNALDKLEELTNTTRHSSTNALRHLTFSRPLHERRRDNSRKSETFVNSNNSHWRSKFNKH